jgi:hypothetical protein
MEFVLQSLTTLGKPHSMLSGLTFAAIVAAVPRLAAAETKVPIKTPLARHWVEGQ